MKLLFDQNLSDQLVTRLSGLFPNSIHTKTVGLNTAADAGLWDYVRRNDYLIVSKTQTSVTEVLFTDILQKLFGSG